MDHGHLGAIVPGVLESVKHAVDDINPALP